MQKKKKKKEVPDIYQKMTQCVLVISECIDLNRKLEAI
jgi:hypothetical protein